jgi:HAD superfamily hydrolase (TIGR01509 family)
VKVCAIRDRRAACNLSRQHSGTTNIPLTANGPGLAQRMRLSGHTSGPLGKGCLNRRTIDAAAEQTDDHPPAVRSRLLDLDGLITDALNVYAACWKQMFDEYFHERATQRDEAFRPLDLAAEYLFYVYVGGKPRFDGVRAFLTSRGIQLREGSPGDPPEVETVRGLGNRKNELVNRIIEDVGVEKPYEGSVKLIHQLRERGFKIPVVTSQNCGAVLKAAKLDALFEVQVDGNVIYAQQLAGKPAPNTCLMAARLLGIEPARTVVVEDAHLGSPGGSDGKFGLVIDNAPREASRSFGAVAQMWL